MAIINVANVLHLLRTTFLVANIAITPITREEQELHDALRDIIIAAQEESSFAFEHDVTLDFEDVAGDHEAQFVEAVSEYNEDYESEACVPSEGGSVIDIEYKTKAVEFWTSGKTKRRSLESVQHRYKKVKSLAQLYRWEESIQRGGTNRDKSRYITEYVLAKFKSAVDKGSIVHDIDLRRWALQAKEDIGYSSFKASHWWIWHFKQVHNIVSRKVTKFITRSSQSDMVELQSTATRFVNDVKPRIKAVGQDNVYNADESGFTLEIHSGRTLSVVGTRTVEATVQSLSSMTHSYTILPTISSNGRLLSPLFLVLKEVSGHFGPHVEKTLFRPDNVHISASTSGKLTSHHFQTWFTDVFLSNTGAESLLLLDAWSGHCSRDVQELVPPEKKVTILTIPKKTTSMVQPLDVFGFRIWKNFVRTFSDEVLVMNYDINLHQRNTIIKLQSLTHNQLSSPRFFNLFKYAWYKSGYIDERPPHFDNPVHFCFARDTESTPQCNICGKPAFIRCGWCKQFLCFKHFYEEYHYCNRYLE